MAAPISNSPTSMSMQNFRSAVHRLGGPAKQCRYAVRILPVSTNKLLLTPGYQNFMSDLILLCESAQFPGRGMDFVDARYYGPAVQMPYNTKYEQQMDFSFLCRTESYERQLFDDWLDIINPSDTFDFNYLADYQSEVQIFQLSEYPNSEKYNPQTSENAEATAVYQWSLIRAWPMMVHPQPVTWADQDVLRLSVTFSYRYWYRPNKDVNPRKGNLILQP